MNIEELKEQLRAIADNPGQIDEDHIHADVLLLKYINDPEVTELFESIEKWYA